MAKADFLSLFIHPKYWRHVLGNWFHPIKLSSTMNVVYVRLVREVGEEIVLRKWENESDKAKGMTKKIRLKVISGKLPSNKKRSLFALTTGNWKVLGSESLDFFVEDPSISPLHLIQKVFQTENWSRFKSMGASSGNHFLLWYSLTLRCSGISLCPFLSVFCSAVVPFIFLMS